MIYKLKNSRKVAKLFSQLQHDITIQQKNLSDFRWFIQTVYDAISQNLTVELRYYVDEKDITYSGKIQKAKLEYSSEKSNLCTLSIVLKHADTDNLEKFIYTFDAELVRENSNCTPDKFMKYYINDYEFKPLVTIIVKYKELF